MASCSRIMRRFRPFNIPKVAVSMQRNQRAHYIAAFGMSSCFRNGRNQRYSIMSMNRYFSGIHPDFQTSFKTDDTADIKKQIEADVTENEVFLFMKGTPAMPQCGFSKNCITILNYLEVDYKTRDVLSHPALRSAIKEYRYFVHWYCSKEIMISFFCLLLIRQWLADIPSAVLQRRTHWRSWHRGRYV